MILTEEKRGKLFFQCQLKGGGGGGGEKKRKNENFGLNC